MNSNMFEFRPWPIHIGLMCPLVSEKPRFVLFLDMSVFQIALKVGGNWCRHKTLDKSEFQ